MGIASGRIIDRSGMKRLPVGIEDFQLVAADYVYVDKSLLARDLVDSSFNAVLFCRPRRFGKSLAMRMLQCFFEAPVADARVPIPDRRALFEGLAVMDAGGHVLGEMGAHPVIYLSLAEAAASTWQETRILLAQLVARECGRHDYVLGGPAVGEDEAARMRRLIAGRPEAGDLETSLSFLSDMLARHHGAGTVILIDEYDAPVTQGHLRGFRDEAVGFMRTWLTGALKATTSLYLGVMTGVQRVSRESIFSGLNNIAVDTALNHKFTEAFGFTDGEAVELAGFLGLDDRVPQMRDWYDGYRFGDDRVYNPWSLLNCLADGGAAQPYWGNTSSNAIVHGLFARARGATADELAELAAGGTVRERIDLATVFDMIDTDPQAIWSQLYLAGYVTTDDTAEPNDAALKRRLRVPNREVGRLFRIEFGDRSRAIAGSGGRLYDLHDALVEGDAPGLAAALRRILLDSPSALDLVRENSYHMLLLGLVYDVRGYRFPVSNREAGDGRADVLLVPERENRGKLPSIAAEVKWGKKDDGSALDDEALAALAQEALDQVDLRSYPDPLPEGPVLKWGVAFSGKHAAAVCVAAHEKE